MRIGIIGAGAIAERAHIPAFQRAGATIVAIADTDPVRARKLAERVGIPEVYSDFKQMLDENLDVVSICTPPITHASIALEAAKQCRNILLEKPMATNLPEAEHLVEICNSNKVKLCVVHQYRFIPCVQSARRRIVSGRIGNIITIQLTAHPQFPMRWSDSAWLYDKWSLLDDFGVHLFDVLSYLTDASPLRISTFAHDSTGKMGFFDSIQVLIELGQSLVAYVDLSWISGSTETTANVFGTAGKITLDIRNNSLTEVHGYITPFDEMSATIRKSTRTIASALSRKYFKGTLLYHELLIRSFLSSISNDTSPPVGPLEGKKIVEFLEKTKAALN
jgi:predicted dehydrogenase